MQYTTGESAIGERSKPQEPGSNHASKNQAMNTIALLHERKKHAFYLAVDKKACFLSEDRKKHAFLFTLEYPARL